MRVLVTGGAGFIGSHVVEDLVAAGHEVVVLDSLHPAAHSEEPDDLVTPVSSTAGATSPTRMPSRTRCGVSTPCHTRPPWSVSASISRDVVAYAQANDIGTASLLRVLHDSDFAGRLVLASSMVVYGEGAYECAAHGPVVPEARDPERLAREEWEPVCSTCGGGLVARPVLESARLDPRNVYAATKLHQEHLCAVYGRDHAVPVVALRYHNVYGPRMPRDTPYAGVASIFRSSLESGRAPLVYEDGGQVRDFVHVRDVARANRLGARIR